MFRVQSTGFLFRAGMALSFLFGTVLANGCLFQPREPETPSEDSAPWILPIDPQNVLANMESALESLTSTNYENSLGEEFQFFPSWRAEEDAAQVGFSFEGYRNSRELDALAKLYTLVDSLRVEWNFDPSEDMTEGPDEAQITLEDYQLFVSYSGSEPTEYSGSAEMTLRLVDGQWVLVTWDESNSTASDLPDWGQLRVTLDN